MNVEIALAKRMLFRAAPIYLLVPILFLIKSVDSFLTSLISGIIVAVGFYLGAFIMSYAAKISLNVTVKISPTRRARWSVAKSPL